MDNKTIVDKTGLSRAEVCRMLNRAKYGRQVSWRQAYQLSKAFGGAVTWWRMATEKQIKRRLFIKEAR